MVPELVTASHVPSLVAGGGLHAGENRQAWSRLALQNPGSGHWLLWPKQNQNQRLALFGPGVPIWALL